MGSDAFRDFLADQFAPIGGVTLRRMFGGLGVFRDGLMFALGAGDVLYFKVDGETAAAFEAERCEPFSYDTRDGRRVMAGYRRAPERLFDDDEAFAAFAEAAFAVARRAAAKAPRAKRAGPGGGG